jgi:glutamate-1-semialdehyde aminotransferase
MKNKRPSRKTVKRVTNESTDYTTKHKTFNKSKLTEAVTRQSVTTEDFLEQFHELEKSFERDISLDNLHLNLTYAQSMVESMLCSDNPQSAEDMKADLTVLAQVLETAKTDLIESGIYQEWETFDEEELIDEEEIKRQDIELEKWISLQMQNAHHLN